MSTSTRPTVSVIVPIYKVEQHLRQCVDSILAQTLEGMEIILVDDGSPDGCPQIVDEYAAADPRVVAVHQPNGGYGRAVNHGIELARGEYIGLIESDDWIEPDMYETLYANAKEFDSDVVKCGFYYYNSTMPPEHQSVIPSELHRDLDEAPHGAFRIEEFKKLMLWHASIWAALYRADFIKQQKLIESASASYQDFPFMVETMCRAERITVVKRRLVHYRVEPNQGSSSTANGRRLLMMPHQCRECIRILKQYGKLLPLQEEFFYHAFNASIGFYRQIDERYRGEYLQLMQEVFAELKTMPDFTYKYFPPFLKKHCQLVLHGGMFRSLRLLFPDRKSLRRFLFTLRVNKKGFCFQLLGLLIATQNYQNKPALGRIRLG